MGASTRKGEELTGTTLCECGAGYLLAPTPAPLGPGGIRNPHASKRRFGKPVCLPFHHGRTQALNGSSRSGLHPTSLAEAVLPLMLVHVLLNASTHPPIVFAAVTSKEDADNWLHLGHVLDASHGAIACEIDDYSLLNDYLEAMGKEL